MAKDTKNSGFDDKRTIGCEHTVWSHEHIGDETTPSGPCTVEGCDCPGMETHK